MPKQQQLAALQKEHELLSNKCRKLYERIEALQNSIELPALRKKYEGKFFKYRNSFGSKEDGWWLYSQVVAVDGIFNIRANTFQIDKYGKYEFEINRNHHSDYIFEIEITPKEYYTALRLFSLATNQLKQLK